MMVRIGITTSFEDNRQQLRRDYVRAVEQAGGLPLVVPMIETDAAARALTDLLDGLIITGGPAVTEGLIGTLPDELSVTDPVRLHTDGRLLNAFVAAQKPILGICYGMQLLNAYAGGTIYADVERQLDGALVHSQKRGGTTHSIRIDETTHLYALLDTAEVEVNTRHVQALASVGEGYRVAATAPDGVIEAIENEAGTVLGVQFHPERMGSPMHPLFRHLVTQARAVHTASVPAAPFGDP